MKPGVPVDQSGIPVLSSAFGLGGGQATPTMEQLSDVDAVGITNGEVLVWDAASSTWVPSTVVSGSQWFNVMNYGALNDGTTDDTTAIDAAIAAMNAATKGVLYFPAGTGYKVTAALTTITANGIVMGDGMGVYNATTKTSAVNFTSQTAVLFTVTAEQVVFKDIGLYNTFAGTASAGSAIHVNGSHIGQKVDLESVLISHFYDNVVRDVGSQWVNHNVWNYGAVRYGESIQNTVNQDAGDWSITDCNYFADVNNGTAAIFMAGAGGGKVTSTKINGHGGGSYTNGILVTIPNAVTTVDLQIANISIENVGTDCINISTAGTGQFALITIVGSELETDSNTGRAIKITANATGGLGTNGGLGQVVITGIVARTTGTARAAISLTKTDNVVIDDIALAGFNARYTGSSDTNTNDLMAAAAGGTVTSVDMTVPAEFAVSGNPVTTSGTLAITKANESANTVWAGPTSGSAAAPTFRALVAADIPAGISSPTDHQHIMNLWFSGDGSTTVFTLPAAAYDSESVRVWVSGTLTDVTLSGAMLDTMTFGSAPASATNNIVVDLVAAAA
jgi:hypothetical protein